MRTTTSAAVVAVTLLAVGGCAQSPESKPQPTTSNATSAAAETATPSVTAAGPAIPSGKSGKPRGGLPGNVDGRNVSAVANAFALTINLSDTRLDLSPNDASRRARGLMAPSLSAQYATPLPGGGGAPWAELKARQGYTKATAVLVDGDDESQTRATRTVQVTVTQLDATNKPIGTPDIQMVGLVLVRDTPTASWRVLRMDLS